MYKYWCIGDFTFYYNLNIFLYKVKKLIFVYY